MRGFLGRRYAARCWLEAREQSDAAEAFLTAVEGLSITTEGQLQTLIAEDSKLPEGKLSSISLCIYAMVINTVIIPHVKILDYDWSRAMD